MYIRDKLKVLCSVSFDKVLKTSSSLEYRLSRVPMGVPISLHEFYDDLISIIGVLRSFSGLYESPSGVPITVPVRLLAIGRSATSVRAR